MHAALGRRLRRRRHGRVPRRRATRKLLLPGDEHPPAGGAPGHRAGHRPGPGALADPGGPGRAAAAPPQDVLQLRGHAIEAASTPRTRPTTSCPRPGRITTCARRAARASATTRGVYAGLTVPLYYDPMISKLVGVANTREEAIDQLNRALGEYVVGGITTNISPTCGASRL